MKDARYEEMRFKEDATGERAPAIMCSESNQIILWKMMAIPIGRCLPEENPKTVLIFNRGWFESNLELTEMFM